MSEGICTSIVDYFSALPDPRILLKTRYKLVDIVTMALCAVIAGADDWVEIASYAKAKEAWFRGFLYLFLKKASSYHLTSPGYRMEITLGLRVGFLISIRSY
jgi:hypothetical protein